mgnify:CR=1 FL=1
MLDTCSARLSETEVLPAIISRYLASGHIAHIQVNDRNRRGPGEGNDTFAPILKALRESRYAGVVAAEPFVYEPDGRACAARSIGYIKGVLETMEIRAAGCPDS